MECGGCSFQGRGDVVASPFFVSNRLADWKPVSHPQASLTAPLIQGSAELIRQSNRKLKKRILDAGAKWPIH